MKTIIRPGRPEDSNLLGDICFRAFAAIADAHRFPWEFPAAEVPQGLMGMLLAHPGIQSFVAEVDGKIIGSNFLWRGEVFGVGPITVDPSQQNGGIGRKLMISLLEAIPDGQPVRLVQSGYHMRSLSLYSKLGFEVREPLVVFMGPPMNRQTPGFEVRPGEEADLPNCDALCLEVHGHTRRAEVRAAITQKHLKIALQNGQFVGYSTGQGYFGHSVARSNAALTALIAAADQILGPGIIVPTRNTTVFNWCLERGLRAVFPLNLMSKGLYNDPKGPFQPSILY